MEFCQQKCDTLRRYLRKMKKLEKLTVLNYYAEGKLGQFCDFNWLPFKKKTHINANTWI